MKSQKLPATAFSRVWLFCAILLAGLFSVSAFGQCTLNGIQISEILPDPNSTTNNHDTDGNGTIANSDEYIKFLNTSGAAVDIGGYQLYVEATPANTPSPPFTFPSPTLIPAGGCITTVRIWDDSLCPLPADVIESGLILGNGGEQIALLDPTTSTYIASSYNGDATPAMTNMAPFTTATGLCSSYATDTDGLSIQYQADGSSINATPTVGGGCGACLITINSLTAVCNGNDADVTLMFSTNMNSGTLNVFTNGVAAGTVAASPIVLSIAGPTSMSTVEVVLVDSLDSTCTVTGEVVIPTCPEPCMISVDSVTAACNGDDAEVTVTFTTNTLTSGAFNVSTGGVTVATATASPVTFTITGPTVAGMIDVAVTDANDPNCTSTNSVSLPECPVSLIGAVVLKELVYDGGCGPFNEPIGEYFILCNPDTTNAVDITGYEFDDDNDFTDGDGLVFPATTTIPAGECIVVSPTTQAAWEAEYGPLPAGFSFVDGSVGWQALGNNGEANLGITMGLNNVGYADIVGEGEFLTFDTNTMMWVAGGPASLICCDETISVSATPSACVNNMYDVEITFNAAFPGGTCVFAGVPDTDKEMVINVNGTDFFFPYTNASPITISNLVADGSAGLPVSLSWEGDAGCATNTTFDAPVACGAMCAIGVGTIIAVCNGDDAEITVPFTTNATSGSFNVTTGGVVVASGTTSPIVFTVTGPTTTNTISVVVTDAADAMCTSTNSVVLPACPVPVPDAVYLKEIVYDVCNPSTLIDGAGRPSGEYVIICNPNATNAADISGYELDDDNDFTDGDGVIFPAGTIIPAGECLVAANASQAAWEAEYGTLPVGLSFFDTAGMWETLGNGAAGDSVGISNGQNNTNYADLAADGESLQWDTNTLAWVNGGPASLVCCAADIFITATPTACMNDMYDLEVTFNAPVPGGSCVFTDVPDADKEIVITVAGVTTNVPWDTTNSTFTLTGLVADGTLSNVATIGWEGDPGCATNGFYDAPSPCSDCGIMILSAASVCIGSDAEVTIDFMDANTSGSFNISTGGVVVATGTNSPIVFTIAGPTTASTVIVVVADAADPNCVVTNEVGIQTCLQPDCILVLTCPPDAVIGCADDSSTNILGSATASVTCTASAMCATAVITFDDTIVPGCTSTITRVWMATVDCTTNTAMCTQFIEIVDTDIPVVTLGPDTNLGCNVGMMLPPPTLTATDACGVVTSGVMAVVTTNGCDVMMVRSAFAMDACGNMGVATQTLTWIEDTEPPDASLGTNFFLSCPTTIFTATFSPTDNCSVASSSISRVSGTNGCIRTITRVRTVIDACGNVGVATQTISWTRSDTVPAVTLGSNTNLGCNPVVPMPMLTVTDVCTVVTSGVSAVVTTNGCERMMVRSAFAVNECGNTGVATQILTWTEDLLPPVVTLGPDTNLDCNLAALPMPMLTATDNCSVVTSGVMAVVTTNGCDVMMVRTGFALDACDNMGSATQTIMWTLDADVPVVSLGSDTNLGCNPTNIPMPTLTVTDVCTVVTSGVSAVVTTNGCDIMMVRSAFAENSCGVIGVATQTLVWTIDNDIPVVTLGPDTNLGCSAMVPGPALTVADSCTIVTSGVMVVVTTNGCDVTMVRTGFAVDSCANMGTATQTIMYTLDAGPPVVTLGADTNLGCNITSVPMPMLTITDVCTIVTSGVSAVITTSGCDMVMVRSAFAENSCGQIGVATQTLVWTIDTDAPIVSLGPDTNLGCNVMPAPPALIVTDNCSVVTSGVAAVVTTNGCELTMVRSAFAMDACGNMGVATQTLVWSVDSESPMVTLGADTNLGCNPVVPMPMLSVTDNCSVVTSGVSAVISTNGCELTMVRSAFAMDACGNMGVATQTLVWSVDSEPPMVTLGADTNLGCNPVVPMPMLSVTDNCSVVTSGVSAVITTNGCELTMVRSAFAMDACGNMGVATQTLVWSVDSEPPMVTLGADTNLGCNPVVPMPMLSVTDNCSVVTSGVAAVVTTNGCELTMVRSAFAMDACGNMGVATQTLVWSVDSEPPMVTLGADTNLGCNPVVPMPMLSVTDNCSVVTSGVSAVITTNGCELTMVRSAFAMDGCGNMGSATQTLVWSVDSEPPMVTLGTDTNLGCNPVVPMPMLSVTDNCSVVTSGVSAVISTNGCELTMVRSAFAMDGCGNMGSATQTLVWSVDSEPPMVTLGADTNLGCNPVVPMPMLSVTDNCSVVTSGVSAVITTNGCELTMVRSAFAMDGCGNMGSATQTLVWSVDSEPPMVTLGADTNLGCNPVVPMPMLSVTDNCSVVTSGVSAVISTNGCELIMVRSAFAMDGCGNMGSATQTLAWTVDTEAPIVVLGPSTNLGCASMLPPPMLSATDTCGVMTSGVSAVVTTNGCMLTMVRTAFAMDACGNMGTATQVLTYVVDNNPPTIVCPTTTLVFTNAPGFDLIITESDLGITASDDCGTPVILASTSVFDCASAGLYTITATVIDACGQTNSCDVLIEIVCASNAVAPSIGVDIVVDDPGCFCEFGPGSFTVSITNDGPVDLMNVTLSDPLYPACETNLPFLAVGDSLIYMCEVTLTGTVNMVIGTGSANGITATAMKTVNYAFDTTPPTLVSCASNITITCGDPIPPPDTLSVVGTDDCPTPPTVLVTTNPLPFCAGMGVEYIYQVADACGNMSAPCTQQVMVVDSGGPAFDTTVTDMIFACGNGIPAPEVVGATDACDGAINADVTMTPIPAGCSLRDGMEYVYSATDACGNSISMTQRITFADSTPPSFNRTPVGRTLTCDEGLPPAESLVATDTCAGNTAVDVQTTAIPNACTALNGVEYVYSASDPCGNNVTVTQRFEYAAMNPPVLSMLPASAVLPCGSVAPAAMQLTAASCGGTVIPVTLTTEPITANCTGMSGTRYTYRATDDCGQSVMHVQEFTFEDTMPPSLICGGDQTITGINADCMVEVPFVTRSASDNCSTTTIVQSPAPGTPHDATQPLVITITASDTCGNQVSCTATYTYECNGRVTGVAWQDLAMDQDPSNDDLSALGLQGIRVTLTDGAGNIIATDTTDAQGGYSFDVPQGMYNVSFNTDDVPANLVTITTPASGALNVGPGTTVASINFGVAPLPTAITLESFDATATANGARLDWSTSWEEDNLGYRIWRGTAEGPTQQLDGFILAENQAAAYTVTDAGTSTHYWLEVIGTDLESEFEATAWTTIPAAPTGPTTLLLQAEDGAADFTAGADTTALVVGFNAEPTATDADSGLRLGGEVLNVDGSFGIYLSPAAGTRVEISE